MTLYKTPCVLALLCAAGALLSACGSPSSVNPGNQLYTRGIGLYPGLPTEHFAPVQVAAGGGERNVALHRAATASSAYDYNLTAQLVTDGLVTAQAPNILQVFLQETEVPRAEKEKLFDSNMLTGLPFTGGTGALRLSFEGPDPLPAMDRMVLHGSIKAQEPGSGRYVIRLLASADGQNWTLLTEKEGRGLPGKVERDFYGRIGRYFAIEAPIHAAYTQFKAELQADGAREWFLHTWDFCRGQERLDVIPAYRFRSAWKASTGGAEWLQVDLGAEASFDRMTLHWLHKAAKGRVQVSANGQDWKTLCALDSEGAGAPGAAELTQVLDCKGRGRYLRLALDASPDGEPYILSEWEVRGKGGMEARPRPALTAQGNTLMLSGGNWRLQRASEVSSVTSVGPGAILSSPGYDAAAWIPATVPATVLSSYYNVGALPDPNYADNQLHISESFFNSDFWYRNVFELPQDFEGKELFLHFDGINWKARVFLNGTELGRIDGAFTAAAFDVTSLARAGENVLAVHIIKNAHPGIIKEKNRISADINGGILGADNPTFHASIGWDWIPTIRGRNIGIWNDVYLTAHAGGVTVEDPFVSTDLPLPDTSYAHILASATLVNHRSEPVEGTLVFTFGDLEHREAVSLAAGERKDLALEPLRLDKPRLWWPVGYGQPHLYEASLRFETGGKVSDCKAFTSGVREMSYSLDGGIFDMYVNGRRLIGNGGNWGFPESNLNFRGREYDIAVAYHADMNFNMIRNWVGMTGDDEFYQACDRHGVMVWQDFWLANPWDGPDPYDNALFLANAQDYVKRIRNHPSIALYVGRNEGDPPQALNEGLDALVSRLHPGHFYLPNSADGPVSGRGPYRALPVKEYFELEPGKDKFHSERGMPNVMPYESLVQMLPPAHQWPQTAMWGLHDFTLENAQQCATFNVLIEKFFGEPKNLQEFASWAQWLNYDGYRAMYESRSWNRKGLLIWMSHSCWPSQVWQTYDYYFEPTAAYFACKKASAPIRIQWNPVLEKVEVVNNSAPSYPELWVRARVINYDGTQVFEAQERLESLTDTTVPVCGLDLSPDKLAPVYFIKLELFEGKKLLADNFYWQGKEENNLRALRELPRVKLTATQEVVQEGEGWKLVTTLQNETQTPALMIRLHARGAQTGERILPAFYSDNYFALLPGETKTVVTTLQDRDTRGERPLIAIEGFNIEGFNVE